MHLTILGCYGPYPPAGGACSGYLLQEGNCRILLDCGNGVLSRLQNHLKIWELDAIILSHLHADHISDIMIMRYGLEMAFNRGSLRAPLPLFAPEQPLSEFERLPYKNAYKVSGITKSDKLEIGPFLLSFKEGVHAVPSMMIRIESPAGVFVYTGDTELFQGIAEFVSGADLFLCEANYQSADLEKGLPNHLSSAQAAEIAMAAGVKNVILTHHHPEHDPAISLAEAVGIFPGACLAKEGDHYKVGSRKTL